MEDWKEGKQKPAGRRELAASTQIHSFDQQLWIKYLKAPGSKGMEGA